MINAPVGDVQHLKDIRYFLLQSIHAPNKDLRAYAFEDAAERLDPQSFVNLCSVGVAALLLLRSEAWKLHPKERCTGDREEGVCKLCDLLETTEELVRSMIP